MPRASEQVAQIIERLEEVRANIYNLGEELKQVSVLLMVGLSANR